MAVSLRVPSWARACLLLTLCLGSGCVVAAGQKPVRHTHTIVISGFMFQPGSLTVDVGDTIVWKNKDIVPHTVTEVKGAFDSGSIKPGATWRLTAKKAGTFYYACTPHPNMQATLIVH